MNRVGQDLKIILSPDFDPTDTDSDHVQQDMIMRHAAPLRFGEFDKGFAISWPDDASEKAVPSLRRFLRFYRIFEGEAVESAVIKTETGDEILYADPANAAVFHPGFGGGVVSFELFLLWQECGSAAAALSRSWLA